MAQMIYAAATLAIWDRLLQHGYPTYVVGGAVRDGMLGLPAMDIDLTTAATPQQITDLFAEHLNVGSRYGTVKVRLAGGDWVDVTTMRGDGEYLDGRRPDAVYFTTDLSTDLSRRDFTINAMALDRSGMLIDPFGGKEDLDRRILATVGKAFARFQEDHLRILRASRFMARFQLRPDSCLLAAATTLKQSVLTLPWERIESELTKLLLAPYTDQGFLFLDRTGVLKTCFPYVRPLHPQFSELPPDPLLRLTLSPFFPYLPSDKRMKKQGQALLAAMVSLPRATTAYAERVWLSQYGLFLTKLALVPWLQKELTPVQQRFAQEGVFDLQRLGLTGDDLLQMTNRPAGAWLGQVLQRLFDDVLKDPSLNTSQKLRQLASKYVQELID